MAPLVFIGHGVAMLRFASVVVLVAATATFSVPAVADVDCAQCRAACSTKGYPGDDRPELRSNDIRHISIDAEVAFNEGARYDPGLGGNDPQRAADGYKRAVVLDPANAIYRNHLAAALMAANKVPEAIYNLDRAVTLAPGEAKYLVNLGYAHHKNRDEQRALVWYFRALALDPLDARARLFAGYALESLGMKQEAVSEYRRVLLQEPTNAGAQQGLARLKAPVAAPPPAASFDPADLR